MKRLLAIFSVAMFSLFTTASYAHADSIVLESHSGNTYTYGLSEDANSFVTFFQGQTINLTGLAGVTSVTPLNNFTDTFTSTSVTLTLSQSLASESFQTGDAPFVWDFFSLTSTSTTPGTIGYSFTSSLGTLSGSVQGPVAGNSPVPEPSSIILLGTGLLAAAGAVRRKLAV